MMSYNRILPKILLLLPLLMQPIKAEAGHVQQLEIEAGLNVKKGGKKQDKKEDKNEEKNQDKTKKDKKNDKDSLTDEEEILQIQNQLDDLLEEANQLPHNQKAFSEAFGFGAYSLGGGVDGKVLTVTSLKDDGSPGTLRWAVEENYPRVVQFAVEGTIVLQDNLRIKNPSITIDGSKAPGKGITLKDGSLVIYETHDVIIRHLRVRPGDNVALKKGAWKNSRRKETPEDAITVDKSVYVLIDHCSASWSSDEVLSVVLSDYVTVQNCFIYEPLANPDLHVENGEKIAHPYGALVSGRHISYINNVFGNFVIRGPQLCCDLPGDIEVVNNYITFYQKSGTRVKIWPKGNTKFHIINNLYENPLDPQAEELLLFPLEKVSSFPSVFQGMQVYISGNISPKRTSLSKEDWVAVVSEFNPKQTSSLRANSPLFDSNTKPIDALSVKNKLLASAGATLPKRDSNDERFAKQVKSKKGEIIISQDDVGGYAEFSL